MQKKVQNLLSFKVRGPNLGQVLIPVFQPIATIELQHILTHTFNQSHWIPEEFVLHTFKYFNFLIGYPANLTLQAWKVTSRMLEVYIPLAVS